MASFMRVVVFVLTTLLVAVSSEVADDFYTQKPRTLIVASKELSDSHTNIIKTLEGFGHDVIIHDKNDEFQFRMLGEPIFENIIVLDSSVDVIGRSKSDGKAMMDFVDDGGNLMVVGGENTGTLFDDVARQAGFVVSVQNHQLVDHFNYNKDLDSGNHQYVNVDASDANKAVLSMDATTPLIYSGPAFKIARGKLSFSVLRAPSTSYAGGHCNGEECVLIGGMQGRNGARVLIVGSTELLSDKHARASNSNYLAQTSILEWITLRKSVLRVRKVEVVGLAPKLNGSYTVMDDIEYGIELEELVNGEWLGFSGRTDMQLAYTRMDPFVIRDLTPGLDGRYSTSFTLPDVYGLFTFKVKFFAHGYSWVDEELTLVIRPLRNSMHERFIPGAFPYYASAFSMMGGVLLLSFVYLYHSDAATKSKTQ